MSLDVLYVDWFVSYAGDDDVCIAVLASDFCLILLVLKVTIYSIYLIIIQYLLFIIASASVRTLLSKHNPSSSFST